MLMILFPTYLIFPGTNLLVRIAGENLASSVPESVSEKCEQCALGLQKPPPDRQLASKPKVELQPRLPKRPGESLQVNQNFQGAGIWIWV
jgi:hypothetical protein